jgi:hypothetical protein
MEIIHCLYIKFLLINIIKKLNIYLIFMHVMFGGIWKEYVIIVFHGLQLSILINLKIINMHNPYLQSS